jgi:hypothetical protein
VGVSKFELAQVNLILQDVDALPLEAQAVLINALELGVVQPRKPAAVSDACASPPLQQIWKRSLLKARSVLTCTTA